MMNSVSSLSTLGQGSSIDMLVSQYMALERRPVEALQTRKDELSVRYAMFNDVKAKLDELRELAGELSSGTDSIFGSRTATSSDSTLATATASSSASKGTYLLENIVLATAHRVRSSQVGTGWSASGESTFVLNGAQITVDAGASIADVRNAINSASYDSGRQVVATVIDGTLVLEASSTGVDRAISVAELEGSLLSSIGLATTISSPVALAGATASSSDPGYPASNAIDGTADDAHAWRGDEDESSWTLTLDLGSTQTVSRIAWGRDRGGALTDRSPKDYIIEYWAGSDWQTIKTVTDLSLSAGGTQTDTFHPVSASQLRITVTATSDGSAPAIDEIALFSDAGSFSQPALQPGGDSSFSVNGIAVTRSDNSSLSDVASGLTLNLVEAGGPVTIQVASNASAIRSKISLFLNKLNSLLEYLKTKSSTTQEASGNYSRGALSGHTLYMGLRIGLVGDVQREVAGLEEGFPSRLSQLGIQLNESMQFVVGDSGALESWLSTNPNAVEAFFGGSSGVAKRVFDRLEPFIVAPAPTSKSYVQTEQDSINDQMDSITGRISSTNERLAMREKQLRAQFATLQALMVSAAQQQQQLQSIFSYSSGWGY